MTAVTVVTVVWKIMQPLQQKSCYLYFFLFNAFVVLLEREIWHIWQPMWCSQGSVLRFSRCFFYICSLRLNIFLPPLLEVQCQIFLDFRNPWGKVMKRSAFLFCCWKFALLAGLFWYPCYYPHQTRDALSPRIFWTTDWFCPNTSGTLVVSRPKLAVCWKAIQHVLLWGDNNIDQIHNFKESQFVKKLAVLFLWNIIGIVVDPMAPDPGMFQDFEVFPYNFTFIDLDLQ